MTDGGSKFDAAPHSDEPLSRFLVERRWYTRNRVTPLAFVPRGGATSVYRTIGMNDAETTSLGQRIFKYRKAWANVTVGTVSRASLTVDPDNKPERHANIVGWPDGDDAQLDRATALAQEATLHLPVRNQ